MCANTDTSTVFIILWRPAKVIPCTFSTDTTQVWAVCLNSFIDSVLLKKIQETAKPLNAMVSISARAGRTTVGPAVWSIKSYSSKNFLHCTKAWNIKKNAVHWIRCNGFQFNQYKQLDQMLFNPLIVHSFNLFYLLSNTRFLSFLQTA